MTKIKVITTISLISAFNAVNAQSSSIDFLRSRGKIYSVVAGVVIIFIGIVLYLWRLDNKLTKLEKHINNDNHDDTRDHRFR